jgi:hypothetical protein
MTWEPLRLEHAQAIAGRLKALGHGISEYEFANLYLFRKIHGYRLVSDRSGPLGISGKTYDGAACFMPLFDPGDAEAAELFRLIRDDACFYPISCEDLVHFDPNLFAVDSNPADTDYVFRAEKLRSYPGRRLAKKRNLVKQFLEAHTPSASAYSVRLKNEAGEVLEKWQQEAGKPRSATDYFPALEALDLNSRLGLFGRVYFSGNEPAGFVLAGENKAHMCTIHFAKGLRRFKGIYPYMFTEFAKWLGPRYSYYNFEQDLGSPNFRRTKRSYQPDRLLVKYRVSRKKTP